jgi:putative Ca2+/H+ antiporter (TMEM165/GDT1 family)
MLGLAFLFLMLFGNMKIFMANYLPLAAAMLLAVSVGLFVSYFAGKKMLAKEIEAEEKELFDNK